MLVWVYAVLLACIAGVATPLLWIAYFKVGDYFAANGPHFALAPFLFGLLLWVLFALSRGYRSADGFTYFISDLHFQDGRRKLRYSMIHGLGSFLLLLGGGVLGIEAFCLEVLSSLGSRLGFYSKLSANQVRTLAECGAIAAIAAAMGQPTVAFLFVVELFYGWGGFSYSIGTYAISAFVAASISQSLTSPGKLLGSLFSADGGLNMALRSESFDLNIPGALVSILLVSVAATLWAAITIWFYRRTDEELYTLFGSRRATDISSSAFAIRIVFWAILTAAAAFSFRGYLGVGTSLLHDALSAGYLPKMALIALVLRLLLGVLSYSVLGSVGLLFPTLVEGGILGACLSLYLGKYLPVSTGALALLSLGAYFSASFGAPVAATALVFGYASGLMGDSALFLFTALTTNFASHYLCNFLQVDRLATMGLYRHGIRFRGGMCYNTLSNIQVLDAMLTDIEPIPKASSIGEAYRLLLESKYSKLPVVDMDGFLKGMVSLSDFYGVNALKRMSDDAQIQNLLGVDELMKTNHVKLNPEMNLEAALMVMRDEELVPVVVASGEYCGILLKSDLVNLYNKEVVKKAFRR